MIKDPPVDDLASFKALTPQPSARAGGPRRWKVRRQAGPQPRASRRTCNCGVCGRCLDNARWERIFNEKFADHSYYEGLHLHQRSSLVLV